MCRILAEKITRDKTNRNTRRDFSELAVFPLRYSFCQGADKDCVFSGKYLMVAHAAQETASSLRLRTTPTRTSEFLGDKSVYCRFLLMSDDQILEIDVEGEQLVQLHSSFRDTDDLIKSGFRPLPRWPQHSYKVPNVVTAFLVRVVSRTRFNQEHFTPLLTLKALNGSVLDSLEMMPYPIGKKPITEDMNKC